MLEGFEMDWFQTSCKYFFKNYYHYYYYFLSTKM